MKVIGKEIIAAKCPKCGILLHIERKDWKENYLYGHEYRELKCCNCGSEFYLEKNRVSGIYKLDNPGEYIQVPR